LICSEHGEHKDVKLEKKKMDPTENGKSVVPMVSSSGHVTWETMMQDIDD